MKKVGLGQRISMAVVLLNTLVFQGCGLPVMDPKSDENNPAGKGGPQMPFRANAFAKSQANMSSGGAVKTLEFALLAQKEVGSDTIYYYQAVVDFADGKMTLSGGLSPTVVETELNPGGPDLAVSSEVVQAEEIKSCSFQTQLTQDELSRLSQLLDDIKVCEPSAGDPEIMCPMIGYIELERSAEIIITREQGASYLSRNACTISQSDQIKTLCRDEVEIEQLLASKITDAAFDPQNCQ